MQLVFVARETYRNKTSAEFIQQLHKQYGDFYLVPEGGSNLLALKGCAEIVTDIDRDFDVIASACGTGATLAGMITALNPEQQAIGFAVLKGADFLTTDVKRLLKDFGAGDKTNWHIETSYHFGGYAKVKPELVDFIVEFKRSQGITLDAVYTGKLFYGLYDLVEQGRFEKGTRIIAIHSGGLQGNAGFAELVTRLQSLEQ
jgi:1-aminocyclopropane-1-carboxylate deaminase/D-cysteine desulfhydrase-like pyridoxal-dependent ACC family enzyme